MCGDAADDHCWSLSLDASITTIELARLNSWCRQSKVMALTEVYEVDVVSEKEESKGKEFQKSKINSKKLLLIYCKKSMKIK